MSENERSSIEDVEQTKYNQIGWDFEDAKQADIEVSKDPEVRRFRYHQALESARTNAKPIEVAGKLSSAPMVFEMTPPKGENTVIAEDLRDYPMLLEEALKIESELEIGRNNDPVQTEKIKEKWRKKYEMNLKHEYQHTVPLAGTVIGKDGQQARDSEAIKMGITYYWAKDDWDQLPHRVYMPFISVEGTVTLKNFVLSVMKPGEDMSSSAYLGADTQWIRMISEKLKEEGKMEQDEEFKNEDDVERIFARIESRENPS